MCYLQIANALYYNPSLALAILHKLGVATEIFNLWFGMLKEVKKSGIRANFRRYDFPLIFKVLFLTCCSWVN
jgi:predicted subunit of tRNA(5-methylaminomethyl-2-thiouridylate) methyltransferase